MKDFNFEKRTVAPDGIHDRVEYNEIDDAVCRNVRWEKRMRRKLIMDKMAPYIVLVAIVTAFLVVGYLESSL